RRGGSRGARGSASSSTSTCRSRTCRRTAGRASSVSTRDLAESRPFRTWNGRDSWEFVDGVRLHAIGGEQALLCRVQYAPGKQVPWHKHDDTEQVMLILEGEVEMTIEDDTTTVRAGDVVVVNRGL